MCGCGRQPATQTATPGSQSAATAQGSGAATASGAAAPVAQVEPEKLLRRIDELYRRARTLQVTSEMTMHMQAQGMDNRTTTNVSFVIQKPNRIATRSQGGMVGVELISDGTKLYTYVPMMQAYTENDAPASLDELARSGMLGMGMGGGMFALRLVGEDPYKAIMEGVTSVTYAGTEQLNGVQMHRLKFTQEQFDWDLWVQAQGDPLIHQVSMDMTKSMGQMGAMAEQNPMLGEMFKNIRMTMTERFKDWKLDQAADANAFVFTPPPGATKSDNLFGAGEEEPSPLLGQKAPQLELKLLDAGDLRLRDHADQHIVVLDFWATWCGPCVQEMPILAEVAEEYKDRGVIFYAVNQGETPEVIRAFLEKKDYKINVALDPEGQAGDLYHVQGIPMLVLLDKAGVVQAVHTGFSPDIKSKLKQELDDLLAGKSLSPAE
jgi:peroxiredoxin